MDSTRHNTNLGRPSDSDLSLTAEESIITPNSLGVSPSSPYIPLRSCAFCRQRKVKCDRQQPCSNCVRCKVECSYPAGRGRAAKRRPRAVDTRVVDGLQRLEDIIKRLTSQADTTGSADGESPATDHLTGEHPSAPSHSSPDASIDQQLGRLMIDDSKSYYVSNILWANLGNEVPF